MKTRQEVEELKKQWLEDDIWDIETTSGFEEYKEELTLFRECQELKEKLKEKGFELKNNINKLESIKLFLEKCHIDNYFLAEFLLTIYEKIEIVESLNKNTFKKLIELNEEVNNNYSKQQDRNVEFENEIENLKRKIRNIND